MRIWTGTVIVFAIVVQIWLQNNISNILSMYVGNNNV